MRTKLDEIEYEADFLSNNREYLPEILTPDGFESAYQRRKDLLPPGWRLSRSLYVNGGLKFLQQHIGHRIDDNDPRRKYCALGGRSQVSVNQAILNFVDLLSLI